ncbi:hypothetical protein [Kitasatospora sp. NPDC092286]|uniref:hypothetical protein n=1 Tax=Kitasatospora sp. NPDC092286 TaxID=3364087 RepID=UPI0038038D32
MTTPSPYGPDQLAADAALAALALLRARLQAESPAAATEHQVELVDSWTERYGDSSLLVLLASVVEQAQLLRGDPARADERLAEAEMLLLGHRPAGNR